jgi:hypothetical protein
MAETAARPRPWWRRSEFWLSVGSTAAAIGTAVAGVVPPVAAAVIGVVATMSYTISRGIAKRGTGR